MSAQIIAHPALLAQKRRQKSKRQKAEQKLLSCTTRHLKYLIEVLSLMMKLPETHPMGASGHDQKRAMGDRLNLFRNELQRRDKRDAAPLDTKRLSQRVDQLQTKFRKVG